MSGNQVQDAINPDEIKKIGGGGAWRFSRGQIVRGREVDGKFEETMPRIVGRLMRVGIYEGRGKTDNQPYLQVEADFDFNGTTIHVKAGLSDPDVIGRIEIKPSVSAIKFAWGLTQFQRGDLAMLEAERSKERTRLPSGREGDYVTYVNWFKVEGKNASPIYSPKRDKNAPTLTLAQQWAELEPLIRKHSAFADRPASHDDDEQGNATSHLSALCKEMKDRGWPTPEQEPGKWLAMVAGAFKHEPRARLSDYDDDEWGQVREAMLRRTECPESLRPAPQQQGLTI